MTSKAADSDLPSSPTPPKALSASTWTTEEVKDWFKTINIPELCETLDFCDGDHLQELYNQFCQNPQDFKNEMKSDFQMSSKTYLQFTVALKKLYKEKI